MDDLLEDLLQLISIPSVTPDEQALATHVAARLERLGAEVRLVESLPGRHSVGARLGGERAGPTLVLNGHLDTVPAGAAEEWSRSPFEPTSEDGVIYGRGACDMKAGLAVMLHVARQVAAQRHRLRGALVLHFAIGEERAEPGTRSLLAAGLGGDVGIVLEPTRLRVATAQRGGAALRVRIPGRAAHAGAPDEGVNSVALLPDVLAVLAEYDRAVRLRTHPALPSPTATPTVIRAGSAANIVPEACDITVDRRLLPGERLADEVEDLRSRLAGLGNAAGSVEVIPPEHHWDASTTPAGTGFADRVAAAARAEGDDGEAGAMWGTPYASDVGALINAGGIEAVTFGPGDIAYAHRPDERVAVAEVAAAARTVERVATELLL